MYNNKHLAISIFWVVSGVTLAGLSVAEILDSSLYSCMGSCLTVIGIFQIIRNIKYRHNPEYKEKVDTEIGDERNRFLRMKSWSWAGYIAILVEGVGVVIAMALGQHTVQMVLSYSVCLIMVAYWITYMILSRKY